MSFDMLFQNYRYIYFDIYYLWFQYVILTFFSTCYSIFTIYYFDILLSSYDMLFRHVIGHAILTFFFWDFLSIGYFNIHDMLFQYFIGHIIWQILFEILFRYFISISTIWSFDMLLEMLFDIFESRFDFIYVILASTIC